jgi:zinc/manganese transport system substrate-binding protein
MGTLRIGSRIALGACVALLLLGAASSALADVRVFACEPEWAALAFEIGGAGVSATSATTALQDPHQIQARPSLIARLRNADIVMCNGAELESGWLPLLLIQSANGKVQPGAPGYLMVAEHMRLLEIPVRVDRAQGDVHAAGNPHVNTAPQSITVAAGLLAERLATVDPDRAGQYRSRYEDFSKRWGAAIQRWEARAAPLKGLPVVMHHKAWSYLVAWLGLQEAGYLEPKPGVPPSTAHLNALLTMLRTRPAKLVIRSAYDAPQASDYLSEKLGIPQIVLPYSVGGTPGAKDLFGLFDDTLDRLLKGAQGQSVGMTDGAPR